MARTISMVVPAECRDELLRWLLAESQVVNVAIQAGGSVEPPGDIITMGASNDETERILGQLDRNGLLDRVFITLSEPTAIISSTRQEVLVHEGNEAAWEEVAALLRRDTNLGLNYFVLMAAAGAVAATGLIKDILHIVVGAMLLAPGFEPIIRMVFGLVGHPRPSGAVGGLKSLLAGYAVLVAGAAALTIVMLALGQFDGNVEGLQWVGYWTRTDVNAVIVALPAAIAGVAIIASRRTTFAAGVMVALALVPSLSIVGIGLVLGDLALMAQGLARWAADVVVVIGASALVLIGKRMVKHRRRARD